MRQYDCHSYRILIIHYIHYLISQILPYACFIYMQSDKPHKGDKKQENNIDPVGESTDMGAPQRQERNIDLAPIDFSLVLEHVECLGHVMVAVVGHQVVVRVAEYLIGAVYALVPLLGRVGAVVQHHVLQGSPECQLPRVHGPPPHEIVDGAIGLADAGVPDAGHAAGQARQGCPHQTVRVPVVLGVYLHVYLELSFHLHLSTVVMIIFG